MKKESRKTEISVRGRGHKAQQAMLRMFHGLPVVDAEAPLRIFPIAADISGAKIKDPENCILARACKRMFGSKSILFWRTTAYVELTDENGTPRVERFKLSGYARKAIEKFDKTGIANPAGYTLSPPAPGVSLECQRLQHQARREAIASGAIKNKYRRRKFTTHEFEVRDGCGQVHTWIGDNQDSSL